LARLECLCFYNASKTTINQTTGVATNAEPLATLAYRNPVDKAAASRSGAGVTKASYLI
jgi:hypothetical protein